MTSSLKKTHKRLLLADSFLFNELSSEELNQLVEHVNTQTVKTKEVIFHKSDNSKQMYIIASGKVSLNTFSDEGKELSFGILGKGEIFGEISLFDNKERTATVTAMEPTELLVLEQTPVLNFIKDNSSVALKLLTAFATRLRNTDLFFEDTVFRQLPCRLAKKLLDLADNFGTSTDKGVQISIKLSQNDIGKMSGASRESVNKQMRIWEDNGLINMNKGYITINQPKELETLSE